MCCVMQIAEEIRHLLDQNTASIPAVLEIPSKEHPYDPTKDSILRRAKVTGAVTVSVIEFEFLSMCLVCPQLVQ